MLPFLYNHLVNCLGVNMAFEIKEFIRGSSNGVKSQLLILDGVKTDLDEDDVLRRRNRWRKYSL